MRGLSMGSVVGGIWKNSQYHFFRDLDWFEWLSMWSVVGGIWKNPQRHSFRDLDWFDYMSIPELVAKSGESVGAFGRILKVTF